MQQNIFKPFNSVNDAPAIARRLFSIFDRNNSGVIERDEISLMQSQLSRWINPLPGTEKNMQDYGSVLDTNSDGKITYEDFEALVLRYFCGQGSGKTYSYQTFQVESSQLPQHHTSKNYQSTNYSSGGTTTQTSNATYTTSRIISGGETQTRYINEQPTKTTYIQHPTTTTTYTNTYQPTTYTAAPIRIESGGVGGTSGTTTTTTRTYVSESPVTYTTGGKTVTTTYTEKDMNSGIRNSYTTTNPSQSFSPAKNYAQGETTYTTYSTAGFNNPDSYAPQYETTYQDDNEYGGTTTSTYKKTTVYESSSGNYEEDDSANNRSSKVTYVELNSKSLAPNKSAKAEKIIKLFDSYDQNGDGLISSANIRDIMEETYQIIGLGFYPSDEDIESYHKMLDYDNWGTVSRNDFEDLVIKSVINTGEEDD